MQKLKYREIIWGERKADFYTGGKPRAFWSAYADGDKDGDETGSMSFKASTFPPGAKIVLSLPVCPKCKLTSEMCIVSGDCDFDWKYWAEAQYG